MCVESQAEPLPHAWIAEFCACAHPLNAPLSSKVFMTLVAYMDDSGTHEGSHNSVIAGYWGGVKEWSSFEYRWKEALRSEGLEDHGFHAKEFWPRIDGKRLAPYCGWSDRRHRNFIDRLLTIIETTRITPFAIGVSTSEWGKQPEFYRRIFSNHCKYPAKSPAVLAFQCCVVRVAMYCKPGKRVHFICSRDPQNFPAMWDAYNNMRDDGLKDDDPIAEAMGPLTPENPKVAVQLQAADLIAYEAHRYGKGARGDRNVPVRDEYRRALSRFRTEEDFWLFDEPRFESFKAGLETTKRRSHAIEKNGSESTSRTTNSSRAHMEEPALLR